MMKLAVFVAILAFAAAAPMDDEPSLSVLPAEPEKPEISLLPQIVQPGISLLPATLDDLPAVEIPVVHDDSPCAACFQYMIELINQLSIAADIPAPEQAIALPAEIPQEAVALPAEIPQEAVALPDVAPEVPEISVRPVPIDISQLQRPAIIPADETEGEPVVLPGQITDIIF